MSKKRKRSKPIEPPKDDRIIIDIDIDPNVIFQLRGLVASQRQAFFKDKREKRKKDKDRKEIQGD